MPNFQPQVYIEGRFEDILRFGSVIEKRGNSSALLPAEMIKANERNLNECLKHGLGYILIDEGYDAESAIEALRKELGQL